MRASNADGSRFGPLTAFDCSSLSSAFDGSVRVFFVFILTLVLFAHSSVGQTSDESRKLFLEQASLKSTDFAALEQGEPVVAVLPVQDKKEVAVYGLVRVQASPELFLQSFRDSMASKSNKAILEIGRFNRVPTLDDLQTLTIENRDIEDLKDCVVGYCKLKLSGSMIDRFQKEVDWQAPDYATQATQLFRTMLVEYVRDYLERGDLALIEYSDKPTPVRIAEEQRALFTTSDHSHPIFQHVPQDMKNLSRLRLRVVEDAIVWSKIKFGLKPVLAINHIVIYRSEPKDGSQILIVSKQIYANHYFNASLALTAFVSNPGASHDATLVYQNRSRVDGLGGMFGKLKRGIVERESVGALKEILQHTRMNLDSRALNRPTKEPGQTKRNWREWKFGGVHLFLWILSLTILAALALVTYQWKARIPQGTH